MSAFESYMIDYVCTSKGIIAIPFAPGVILALPFGRNLPLFGLAWATVIIIFLFLLVSPCATDLNCARVAKPTVTPGSGGLVIASIASTANLTKRVTYTGASGAFTGIVKGSTITVSGATYAGYNGTFDVTAVTATTVVVRNNNIYHAPETTTAATITSYVNYNSLRDNAKAFSKAIIIYYILFLFFAVWGRLLLCKGRNPDGKVDNDGFLGKLKKGLGRDYEYDLPPPKPAKSKMALVEAQAVKDQDATIRAAQEQVLRAQQKARSMTLNSSSSEGGGVIDLASKTSSQVLEALLGKS